MFEQWEGANESCGWEKQAVGSMRESSILVVLYKIEMLSKGSICVSCPYLVFQCPCLCPAHVPS